MKGFRLFVALSLGTIAGCVTTRSGDYLYFPQLAQDALSGSAQAFRQVLAQADATPPGEQLEELAEISSRYVRIAPAEFLRAQLSAPTCFGVSFMGPDYVDDPQAVSRELVLRRKALESVNNFGLTTVKQRCLAELAGS